jgi:membrane-associated phospholipid phosphatase
MHKAIAGGAAVVLALTYSSAVWALTIAVAAIAWSRVELGDHTRHQVIGGAIVGALVGGGLFAALILG